MKIQINTNDGSYPIYIGKNIFLNINKLLRRTKINPSKILVVYDSNVPKILIKKILKKLSNKSVYKIEIVFNEKNKTFKTISKILKKLQKNNFNRNDCLISVGGGICGDICGFASSIFKRGLAFVNVPSTFLSQVDSSIGGKTGVNSETGKNMIGTFYQPSIVISDTIFLKSLPKKEMICGYAEILKHSLISNRKFFDYLRKNFKKIIQKDSKHLKIAIFKSCNIKKRIVEKDEKEKNLRKTLNLGHTFAHAFEASKGYTKKLNHGEAVLLGIMSASEFSHKKNLLKDNEFNLIMEHLKKLNYDNLNRYFKIKDIPKIIEYMKQDKKNQNNLINLILLQKISRPIINKNFSEIEIKKFFDRLIYT